ncbi:hypothetical protein [Roseivirga sp.]|uniref:hypothetical protein n=1 Tax=Roseivirga sp. TaxID=1964215 RepID=UPI003B8B412B
MSNIKIKSPYLNHPNRLADVIAAIQALGSYKFYKLSVEKWADRITGSKDEENWKTVFKEHPEFFRFDSDRKRVSLVLRRNYRRNYDVDLEQRLTYEELQELKTKDKSRLDDRISREPLSNSDIAILVSTAIDMHARALQHKKEVEWWKPAIFGLLGVIIGALIKGFME